MSHSPPPRGLPWGSLVGTLSRNEHVSSLVVPNPAVVTKTIVPEKTAIRLPALVVPSYVEFESKKYRTACHTIHGQNGLHLPLYVVKGVYSLEPPASPAFHARRTLFTLTTVPNLFKAQRLKWDLKFAQQ
ncbi:hypothetical protein CISG_02959 [Coccidioides immitis RMSCC 3703]|uniref:Uncharacterized protein n=1 Tax=Coccidioides immitis RMSCC 3703 TaxID=454286 RepID=A0A0J8QIM3_COCIT|nr:hypothetical protein CISG_02959 [Coccidioides immitis RMSCC 3703]